ncbi:MAG: type II secretion system protein GspD [Limisphaerales bacterium]
MRYLNLMMLALAVGLASCESNSMRSASRPGVQGPGAGKAESSGERSSKGAATTTTTTTTDKDNDNGKDKGDSGDEAAGNSGADEGEGGKEAAAGKPAKRPKVRYDSVHDDEIKEVFKRAEENDWEGAEQKASEMAEANPGDLTIERIYKWVLQQRRIRRNQEVEDKIREIDAKNSVFNPTIPGLLTEKKDRGLPPRKDIRDTVEQIENSPYIPESYGKTIIRKGPMFDIESARGRMANLLEKEVSVHLENAPLETIIFTVGQAEGINFVADKNLPAFQQKLSVNLEKVKLDEFLRYVSRNMDIQFQIGWDLIWIVDGKDPKKVQEETRFYRLRHGFILPAEFGASETVQTKAMNPQGQVTAITETKKIENFVRDGAPIKTAIEQAIVDFFKGSKYQIDFERNMIVASGTAEQLQVMDKIVEEFDKPVQQVLIEARFITITEAAFLQLGVQWESSRGARVTGSPIDFTGFGFNVGSGIQEVFTNILDRTTLSATLNALEQSGESQTLSAPRLALVNNRPATIEDGKVQYYYEEYQVKTQVLERRSSSALVPQGKPSKLTSGVNLDVIASIGGDGQTILLALNPRVNSDVRLATFATITDVDEAGRPVSTFDIKLPEYRTQEISTRVSVRSGETVVMGGVLSREQTTFVESVPILGSLPIIGAAFRNRTEVDRPRYLLIFVTATIISDTGEFIRYLSPEEEK